MKFLLYTASLSTGAVILVTLDGLLGPLLGGPFVAAALYFAFGTPGIPHPKKL